MFGKPEVLVVGAGPAGSVSALRVAELGFSVRLVDQAEFPRGKVCGCCLNGRALRVLHNLGLRRGLDSLKPHALSRAKICYGGRSATVPFGGGVALSREALDWWLVQSAIEAGVRFQPRTKVVIANQNGQVQLHTDHQTTEVLSPWAIIAADGLNSQIVARLAAAKPVVDPRSYLGAGATLYDVGDFPEQEVLMAVSTWGYVGLVRLEDGRLDAAAAFDASFVKQQGSLNQAVSRVLTQATGREWPDLIAARWRGTPPLTRQPSAVAGPGWIAVGDASGYVEPFTGEGMAWGMMAGYQAGAFLRKVYDGKATWAEWPSVLDHTIGARRRACRRLTRALRSPLFCRVAVRGLAWLPALAIPFTHRLHGWSSFASHSPAEVAS